MLDFGFLIEGYTVLNERILAYDWRYSVSDAA